MNIPGIVKSIRDIMRKDSGVDGDAQRISQLVWMLFLKIFSDKEAIWNDKIKGYESPMPPQYRWQNWTSKIKLNSDDLIEFVNGDLFPNLRNASAENPQSSIVKSVFEDTHNYMRNGSLFKQVITEINKINFSESTSRHLFNEIYESILKELQSAGTSGEFYTPRAITKFMVEMISPIYGETILDPACGTGGFLVNAISEIIEKGGNTIDLNILQTAVRGIEKKPLPHLLCTTNLMLHGLTVPSIYRDNYLSRDLRSWEEKDKFDIVFSNPPFGGTEEDGTEKNFPIELRTKETADLFIVLIMNILKQNGRAAVVLPDNFLFGEGVRTRIKEKLLNECNLHTIIRLPKGVFNPYTSIKTNLLFFQKGLPTKEIWYFEHQFPSGQKSYTKLKPIQIDEFGPESIWWNKRTETDHSWVVPISDIKRRNYNLDISSPYYNQEANLSSDEIRGLLEKSMKKSNDLLSLLKLEF